MSTEAAGEFFLEHVCSANAKVDAMNATMEAEPFNLAKAKQDAAAVRDSWSTVAATFSDEKTKWPVEVQDDVDNFNKMLYGNIGFYNTLSQAETPIAFMATQPPASGDGNPSQQLRGKLGLSPDTVGSCAGYKS